MFLSAPPGNQRQDKTNYQGEDENIQAPIEIAKSHVTGVRVMRSQYYNAPPEDKADEWGGNGSSSKHMAIPLSGGVFVAGLEVR